MSRMDKVNQQLKKEIGKVLQQELADPRLTFASITHVNTSKDLRNARVYFSLLGNEKQAKEIEDVLNKASGRVRYFIGKRVKMRFTPELIFTYDKSIAEGARMEEIIKDVSHEQNSSDNS